MSQLFYTPEEVDVNERGEFETLIMPESFEEALSYAEQLIWLYKNKQNKLVEGEGVTLTDNADGTTTISVSSDIKGIESIDSTVGTTKTVVRITLTDGSVETFDVLAGPQGPAGADGRQGEDGVGIRSINFVRTEMSTVEVTREIVISGGGVDIRTSTISVPRYNVFNITYTNDDVGILNMYTGNTEYISKVRINNSVTPKETTYTHSMYNTVSDSSSVLHTETIKDGAQGIQGPQGPAGPVPSGGVNGNILIKNSNVQDGAVWTTYDEVYPGVHPWNQEVAFVDRETVPDTIRGWDGDDEVIINLTISAIRLMGDLVEVDITLENTSTDHNADVMCVYDFKTYGSPELFEIIESTSPTYGNSNMYFSNNYSLMSFQYDGTIPAASTETIEFTFNTSDPSAYFNADFNYSYIVSPLNAIGVTPPSEEGEYIYVASDGGTGWQLKNPEQVGDWNNDVAMIMVEPIPSEVICYDYATQTEQIPVNIEFEKVYTDDELTGLIFRAYNTSDDETVIVNYDCNMRTNGADVPVVNDVVGATYGSGGFWYDSILDTIRFGISLELPGGESDMVECSITTTLPGFDVDISQSYTVRFLDAQNGVPDASQASSGDVLTADGSGGCDWQPPSGGIEVYSSSAMVTDTSYDNISAQESNSFLETFFSTNRPSNWYFIIAKLDAYKIGDNVIYKPKYSGTANSIVSKGVSFGLNFTSLASDYVVSQNTMGYLQHRLTSAQYNNLPETIRNATSMIRIPAVFEISFSSTVNFYGDKFRKTFLGFLIFSTNGYCYFDIPNGSMNGETIPAGSNRMLVDIQF